VATPVDHRTDADRESLFWHIDSLPNRVVHHMGTSKVGVKNKGPQHSFWIGTSERGESFLVAMGVRGEKIILGGGKDATTDKNRLRFMAALKARPPTTVDQDADFSVRVSSTMSVVSKKTNCASTGLTKNVKRSSTTTLDAATQMPSARWTSSPSSSRTLRPHSLSYRPPTSSQPLLLGRLQGQRSALQLYFEAVKRDFSLQSATVFSVRSVHGFSWHMLILRTTAIWQGGRR
jgi:hypothetical protein